MLECDCDCCDISLRVASYKENADISHRDHACWILPFCYAQHCFHLYMCMREVSKICTYMYMLLATETLLFACNLKLVAAALQLSA